MDRECVDGLTRTHADEQPTEPVADVGTDIDPDDMRRSDLTAAQLAAERSQHIDTPYPGGQSYHQVVDAMRDVLSDLASAWDGQRIMMIAHSANRWALDCLLLGRRLEDVVDAPFGWQEGWQYLLPSGWTWEAAPAEPVVAPQPGRQRPGMPFVIP